MQRIFHRVLYKIPTPPSNDAALFVALQEIPATARYDGFVYKTIIASHYYRL